MEVAGRPGIVCCGPATAIAFRGADYWVVGLRNAGCNIVTETRLDRERSDSTNEKMSGLSFVELERNQPHRVLS